MPRVLLVEDDPLVEKAVRKVLSLEKGYSLVHLDKPERALDEVRARRPDLILLDVMMPGADGRLVLKALKSDPVTAQVPVILLTGLSSESDKVLGLNLGADDYITKPFGALELLARIQAALRRNSPPTEGGILQAGGVRLDPADGEAVFKGKDLRLQPREFEVLKLLLSSPGKLLSRTYLIENSSSYGMAVSSRSLDTHIKNLRKKLGGGAAMIQTVPRRGYRFEPGAAAGK
ncbi:MAG: response regulator transcription factor [Elusimicrobiota bacterium]